MEEWDHVIVGAGSAGSALAAGLSEDPRCRVLLLEAGGSDRDPWIRMPIGYGHSFHDPRVNWRYMTGPLPELAGRRSYWPRGKVLGGSSSINAMVWVRGHPRDFEDWRAAGNPGWGWDEVAPVFRAIERTEAGEPEIRGRDGPLDVTDMTPAVHPLCGAFLAAAEAAGFPRNPDYNGRDMEGVAPYQITTRKGLRASAATAFLRPAMRRANLTVRTRALALRLLLEDGRATGVEYRIGRDLLRARVRRAVILAAGAVGSPLLLQRSGIGPGGLLAALGIPVLRDLPGVGANLQDHLGLDYLFRARVPTLNQVLGRPLSQLRIALRYALFRDGPLALSVNQAGGFVRARPGAAVPDTQLYFSPVSYTKAVPGRRVLMRPDPFPGFFLGVQPCRPESRGRLALAAPDPDAPPLIEPNYLGTPGDIAQYLASVRLIRRIAREAPLAAVTEAEIEPGPGAVSDEDLLADIRARAGSVFHPCATCRMGPDPARDVVDARLRVHGVPGLRIADASVFPNLTSGNTNAAAIMVGVRAAEILRADARAAPAPTGA